MRPHWRQEIYLWADCGFSLLFAFAILGGNIVLGHLVRVDFAPVRFRGILYPVHNSCFECLAFLHEFFDAFGIHVFDARQGLNVPGLSPFLQSNTLVNARP